MSDEQAAFLEHQTHPTSDSLIRLLRAHQDRVFRLCFQVLHNFADAEDAAQAVLMRVAPEVRRFADADEFRRWLNRVSLNAALEVARKAARRRRHEARAAMEKIVPAPIDPADRLAMFEAIAGLDDASRNLILEHYFEGQSLEALGHAEGVSAPAVHKRLEGAREKLRRGLGGAGALAAVASLRDYFPPTPPAPDLVTGSVLVQAATVGGAIMTAKASIGATVALAVVCLAAGGGAGAMLASKSNKREVEDLKRQLAAVHVNGPTQSAPAVASTISSVPMPSLPKSISEKEATVTTLLAKLTRFKEWWAQYRAEYDAMTDQGAAQAYRARKLAEMGELLMGLRELIFSQPAEFLAFARDPGHGEFLRTLLLRGLGIQINDMTSVPQEFSQMPRELNDGLMDLLRAGTPRQRMALLEYFSNVFSQPESYRSVYPTLLSDPDETIQRMAVQAIWRTGSWSDESFAAVTQLGRTTSNSDTRMAVANSMMWVPRPEAVTYLVDRLGETRDYMEAISVAQSLSNRIRNDSRGAGKPTPVEVEDRIAQAVAQGMSRGFDGATFLTVLRAGLSLPLDKLRPLLNQAAGLAPTDHARETVAKLSELAAGGSVSPDELLKASWE